MAHINGSRIHDCHITKTVKKSDTLPESCRIGDSIFESGTHTWKIEIDHSDCSMDDRVDFTVGVIDCINQGRRKIDNWGGQYSYIRVHRL